MKPLFISIFFVLLISTVHSQSVGINSDGSTPHSSAALDIKSSNKGLLVPRLSLSSETDATTIASPQTSLLIFNTNASLPAGVGFYFWNGTRWSKLPTTNNLSNFSWGLTGNSETVDSNFIGTTDSRPLIFKTDNILSGKIEPTRDNVFFGQSAGLLTTGQNNTFIGHLAGSNNSSAPHNTGIGRGALRANTTGAQNTAVGSSALDANTTGQFNIALGVAALRVNTTGSQNTGLGTRSLFTNTTGSYNLAIGNAALYNNTTGNRSIAIGDSALHNQTVPAFGGSNLAIGFGALFNTTTGFNNTGVGYKALYSNDNSNYNAAFGTVALESNTGDKNSAFGNQALQSNLDADENSAFGYLALRTNTTGSKNSAFGANALTVNQIGNNNAAFGADALGANTTGHENTAFGVEALKENTTSGGNVAIGYQALATGNSPNNTAVGSNALQDGGSDCTAVGRQALILGGDYCTAIGAEAGPLVTNLFNATAIGYYAKAFDDNSMVFGNSSVTRWTFGISSTGINRALEVGSSSTNGNGAYLSDGGTWTNTSDVNKKEDFSALDEYGLLQKISQLSIQRWKYKGTNEYHIGPTAQDFYKAFDVGTDDKGISTVDPAGISLAAIKILIKENEMLKKENESLRTRIELIEQTIREKLK
jgi:trimeric autotransporter adhesin